MCSGGATYRSGCSQEHPDLKKIKRKKIYFKLNQEHPQHKIRNTLKLKKNLFVKLSSKKKKKKAQNKIELKSEKKKKKFVTEPSLKLSVQLSSKKKKSPKKIELKSKKKKNTESEIKLTHRTHGHVVAKNTEKNNP